jgi:hypothetical protein
VAVTGTGGLTLITNDGGSGGTFSTGDKGRVSFANLSSAVTINGTAYTLIADIKTLAADIAANPAGDYALADDYDASKDGIYSNTPITTTFTGDLEGLGNSFSHISVNVPSFTTGNVGGLFLAIQEPADVENLSLDSLDLQMGRYSTGVEQNVGGLVDGNSGNLFNDRVTGRMNVNAEKSDSSSIMGGMVAANINGIFNSYADVKITAKGTSVGGLVGNNEGGVENSFATGDISSDNGPYNGGLIGANQWIVENSYATGSVTGTGATNVGGFVGLDGSAQQFSTSYSTGHVTKQDGLLGGFVGDVAEGAFTDCYWDTQTSGTNEGSGEGNGPGLTGLTTKQMKSGLPSGFDPTVWAEDKKINKGLPYLIANPPPKK